MATNICLAMVLCRIVIILQMSRTRYLPLALFSSRILYVTSFCISFNGQTHHRIIIPTSFKVRFLFQERHLEHHDPTSTSVDIVISSVLIATTTIMATTLPFMNPVMGHLQPGWSTGAVRLSVGIDQRPARHGEINLSEQA
jgi:hypothetical protein